MTPAVIPVKTAQNHLRQAPLESPKSGAFRSEFPTSDHLTKFPDPLCGAVLTAGGRQSDPLPLSCTFFDRLFLW